MSDRQKNILVWVLTWAGLLLAVLYSPIGSPELYTSFDYNFTNQNVNFNGGHIENAQNVNFESGNNYNELNVPDYNSAGNSSKLSSGNYNYATNSNYNTSATGTSYASSESQSYQNMKNGLLGSTMSGGNTFISNNSSSRGIAASSAVTMNNAGITTLSASTTTLASNTKAAGVQYDPNKKDGGQNPGGDPDPQTRIPVPDGWVFLLLLAGSYGIIKKKFFTA